MATAMKCADAEELIALAVLGALERDAAGGLEAHIASCARCSETARDFQRAVLRLHDSLEPATPSRQLRRRIMGAVYAGTAAGQPRRHRLAELWRRLPQSRAYALVAAGAVAATAALAVWGATRATAPGAETFAVVPAAGASGAHGQLTYFPGEGRSVLTVTGMAPPARAGGPGVYEVWLVPHAGAPLAAAFMSPVPGTNAWSAVITGELRNYQAVAATVEPPGGEPQPTGSQEFVVPLAAT